MANNDKQVTGWAGWVYFAGFLMVLMGIFQMIAGLAALLNERAADFRIDRLVADGHADDAAIRIEDHRRCPG